MASAPHEEALAKRSGRSPGTKRRERSLIQPPITVRTELVEAQFAQPVAERLSMNGSGLLPRSENYRYGYFTCISEPDMRLCSRSLTSWITQNHRPTPDGFLSPFGLRFAAEWRKIVSPESGFGVTLCHLLSPLGDLEDVKKARRHKAPRKEFFRPSRNEINTMNKKRGKL